MAGIGCYGALLSEGVFLRQGSVSVCAVDILFSVEQDIYNEYKPHSSDHSNYHHSIGMVGFLMRL